MSSSRLIGRAESVKAHREEDEESGAGRGACPPSLSLSLSACCPCLMRSADRLSSWGSSHAAARTAVRPSSLSLSFFLSLLLFLSLPGRRAGVRSRDAGQSKERGVGRRLPRQGLTSGRGWGGYISRGEASFLLPQQGEPVCAAPHKERSSFVPSFQRPEGRPSRAGPCKLLRLFEELAVACLSVYLCEEAILWSSYSLGAFPDLPNWGLIQGILDKDTVFSLCWMMQLPRDVSKPGISILSELLGLGLRAKKLVFSQLWLEGRWIFCRLVFGGSAGWILFDLNAPHCVPRVCVRARLMDLHASVCARVAVCFQRWNVYGAHCVCVLCWGQWGISDKRSTVVVSWYSNDIYFCTLLVKQVIIAC